MCAYILAAIVIIRKEADFLFERGQGGNMGRTGERKGKNK